MNLSTLITIFKRTGQRFVAKDTFEMGAALAYYTVFSLAPLVLIAIAIAGLVFEKKAAEGRIAGEIENTVGPEVADAVEQMLHNAGGAAGTATASVVGIVLLIFGASGVFVQLQGSLNAIWECPTK